MPLKNTILWILVSSAIVICLFLTPMLLEPKHKIYNSDYSAQEIEFGEKQVYPKASTKENLLKTYFEALKNKDKLTVKLLSTPDFPTMSPEMWQNLFDKFWEKYQGESVTYSQVAFEKDKGCEGIFISLKEQKQFVCVNKTSYEKYVWFTTEKSEYYMLSLLN